MRHGNLFVVSGPSGAGKGTSVARLLREVPDAWLSVSATTRQPREGEVEGVSYFFKTPEQFQAMIDGGDLLEWAEYGGNRYGTPRSSVVEAVDAGRQVVLEIDVQGGFQVKELFPEAHLVFVEPPSLEVLEQRLVGRGTDSPQAIAVRMEAARDELAAAERYERRIVNDDLEQAAGQLVSYVNAQAESM